MNYKKVFFIVALLAFLYRTQSTETSGIKIRLTDRAFSYVKFLLTDVLKNLKFPRIQVDVDGGPGHGKIEISKIRFGRFETPEYSYEFLPPNQIQLSSKDGVINLQADWAAWYKLLFKITLDGTFSVTAENVQLMATIDVARGKDGRPLVTLPVCQTKMNNVKVKIAGGPIPSIINLFRGPIAEAIQNAYETQVCKKIQDGLEKLKTLPPKIPVIRNMFQFDYTLTNEPTVTRQHVQGAFNGSITYKGEPPAVPAPPMPFSIDNSRMMYIWATDFVPNSLFTSAQKNNLLKYEISRENTPQYAPFLRTTCPGSTCFGSYREKAAELYPNKYVFVELWSSKAPNILFNHEKSEINVQIRANVSVEPKNDSKLLLYLQVDLKANLVPYVIQTEGVTKVAGNATVEEMDMQVFISNVGEISEFEIWVIMDVIKPKVQDALNARLGKGVVIPLTEGIHLVHPNIKMLDRAIQIETDFQYKDHSF